MVVPRFTTRESFKKILALFFDLYPFIFISQINLASFTGSSATQRYLVGAFAYFLYIYTEGYSESTEPIDAVNILSLARFEHIYIYIYICVRPVELV